MPEQILVPSKVPGVQNLSSDSYMDPTEHSGSEWVQPEVAHSAFFLLPNSRMPCSKKYIISSFSIEHRLQCGFLVNVLSLAEGQERNAEAWTTGRPHTKECPWAGFIPRNEGSTWQSSDPDLTNLSS